MAPYETQVQQREWEQDRWCGDRRGGGWRDDPTQCGPSPKATCYQALRRAPIQSAFKYISVYSPICIHFSHYIWKWPNVSPAQCGSPSPARGSPHLMPIQPAWSFFLAVSWSDNCSSSQYRRLFNWICLRWQNCFAHWVFPSSPTPIPLHHRLLRLAIPVAPSLPPFASLGVYLRAMGKGQANDSQWLLISTICSALGHLSLKEKATCGEKVTGKAQPQ